MSDHDALLAGVLANPDDDLPRLVYADFLEEAGDPARAEFIRVQCAITAGQFEDERERIAMELRERYLRDTHGAGWLAPLKKKGEPLFTPRSHGMFRRGFVERVWMPAAWFVQKAEKLFSRCPVNELRVTMTTSDEFEKLLYSSRFHKLTTLELTVQFWSRWISVLQFAGQDGQLQRLARLRLRSCQLGGEYPIEDLCGVLNFAPVELDLRGNPLTEKEIGWLRKRYGDALICDEPE